METIKEVERKPELFTDPRRCGIKCEVSTEPGCGGWVIHYRDVTGFGFGHLVLHGMETKEEAESLLAKMERGEAVEIEQMLRLPDNPKGKYGLYMK